MLISVTPPAAQHLDVCIWYICHFGRGGCSYSEAMCVVAFYFHILYFAWEDQSKKSAVFIIKLQVCCIKNKAW